MFGRRQVKSTVASKDWFRSSDWDERARVEFGARLARAKPYNRFQYRRIKASVLLLSGDRQKEAGGRELFEEILADDEAPGHEKTTAHWTLGAYYQRAGHLHDAERHLRAALDRISRDENGRSDVEEVQLAEVLLARGGRDHLEEARDILDRRASPPPTFVSSRFRMCLAGVRVTLALKDRRRAAEWAAAALDLAAATHSGLANHPTLGLVEADSQTRAWLTAVAADRS